MGDLIAINVARAVEMIKSHQSYNEVAGILSKCIKIHKMATLSVESKTEEYVRRRGQG